MDFDEIQRDFGEFGTFQKMVIYLVLLPSVIPCGFHAYNQVFMSATPEHWCRVPELENRNLSMDAIKNLSIPTRLLDGVESYEGCVYYGRNYSESFGVEAADKIPCRNGWLYDDSKYTSTVVTEWDLVCDFDFSTTLALVLFGVGGAIGNFIFGYTQDSGKGSFKVELHCTSATIWNQHFCRLGRKISFFIYLAVETVFGVASAFPTDFPVWVLLRFGVGFTVPAILGSPYVLSVELVGPKERAYCTILINIAYSLGLVVLSGVFYLVREWRQLTLVTTLPFVFLFFNWWVMPESPRWLYSQGRFDECAKILKKMADVNGINLTPEYMEEFKERCREAKEKEEKHKRRHYGVMDLLRTPNLRRKTVVITLIWFTNTAVYVGLSYYAPALGSDEFLNFFLAGVVELPTYIFLWPAMEKLGRRWTLCLSMVMGGLACLATFLTQNRETITLVLYCLGKMGISSSFVVLPLMASELYPTVVRGVGMSFSSVVGQIGPIVIPLVNYLGEDWMVLPLIIMGGLLVFGGGLSLILPETLHQHLPETIEEAEVFGKESSSSWLSKRSEAPDSAEGAKNEAENAELCHVNLSPQFESKTVETF